MMLTVCYNIIGITIALVTASSVLHWFIENDAPTKIFDLDKLLNEGSQIMNYQVSAYQKWCLLYGICAGPVKGTVVGNMQLNSIE